MRKFTLITIVVISMVSCKAKHPYTAKVYLDSTQLPDNVMTDDKIKAEDDFNGYMEGVAFFLVCKKALKESKMAVVTDFDVFDENGVNLKYKLTPKEIDSANKIINESPALK